MNHPLETKLCKLVFTFLGFLMLAWCFVMVHAARVDGARGGGGDALYDPVHSSYCQRVLPPGSRCTRGSTVGVFVGAGTVLGGGGSHRSLVVVAAAASPSGGRHEKTP